MDPPHLLRLGFLLLALATPHPNVATSSDDSAQVTQNSSSVQTNVTVYYCKDCERSRCKSEGTSFEGFDKIAETQLKVFSNKKIELVTTDTNITMCLQRGNSLPRGIYGIFWEKAGLAPGLSCGILNSGAFLKNGRENISTEEDQICCVAETDMWKRNPTLKCYTEPLAPKPTTPSDYIPGVRLPGVREFLTSKRNTIGILFTFLIVGVLAGMAITYYFLRLRRGQAFTEDSPAFERESLAHA